MGANGPLTADRRDARSPWVPMAQHERADVLEAVTGRIAGLANPRPLSAAMNGRTAAKGTLAEERALVLERLGRPFASPYIAVGG